MKDSKDKKNIFSEWLEKLQQESWQLELLISGFALFGIWESKDLLQAFSDYINVNNPVDSNAVTIFKIFGLMLKAAWAVFFINLLIHVILRGLWIGAIGLRYVSGDIEYDSLNFSTYFNEYFKRKVGHFDDYIERLEKVCSVIFAYTFLLFFIFLSSAIFIIFTIFLVKIIDLFADFNSAGFPLLFLLLFLFLGLIVFIDFITLGAFKKVQNKNFSKAYSYVYRFFSTITLSFIYRPLLYNFVDYKYTRRLFWFSIPYVFIITIVIPNFSLEANPYFPSLSSKNKHFNLTSKQIVSWNNYDDLREEHLSISRDKRKIIQLISLKKQEFTGAYGSFFLRQLRSDQTYISQKYGITPFRKSGLRHRMFTGKQKDSLLTNIENQKASAVLKILKERKAKKNKDTLSIKIKDDFMKGYNYGIHGEFPMNLDEYLAYKLDSTKLYWDQKIEKIKENKLLKIKDALMDFNEISIDGKPYNKDLSCKFFMHPNFKEKGLICYFPIDSLGLGEHILTLNRSLYSATFTDSTYTKTINIPFWKTSK